MAAMGQGKYNDVYGRQKFLDMMGAGEYDLIWILQDTFIVMTMIEAIIETQIKHHHPFKTILYFPIDAAPVDDWVKECVSKIDYPVAYTQYAYNECVKIDSKLKDKLRIIYHGTNTDDFYPMGSGPADMAVFRHAAFRGEADGKFLITNINRNQRRKDLARSFMVLKEMRDRGHKDTILYMHAAVNDVGGHLIEQGKNFGFTLNKEYMLPENFNVQHGLPIFTLNQIYNSSDCLLTTTLGEGWGLSVTEAFATKTPVVAPDNTSLSEICADGRAHLVKSGENSSMWMIKDQDNDRLRPLMDVGDAADKIEMIMQGKLPDVEGAYEWAQKHDWKEIVKQWDSVCMEAIAAPVVRPYQAHKRQPKMAIPSKKRRH